MIQTDAKLDFSLLSQAAEILDNPKRHKAALVAGRTKENEAVRALDFFPELRKQEKSNG